MDSSNPWANQTGSGNASSYTPHYQEGQQPGGLQQHPPFQQTQSPPPAHDSYHSYQQPSQQQHPEHPQQPPQQQGGVTGAGYEAPPGLPPRRSATEQALPQGQDHSHQVEVMQSYEMSREQTEDELNQSILQREFPGIDSSLIAAIYNDSGSLSATREMLQELTTGD
ncbi:hypothetical protein DM02DRAFT_608980 [Periconia macrospinosa]|uniref:CUE domain-containing protein n=1 Tax=Periconia macrospinosa TaxID=97972 RepID=A0A2V1E9Y7_9PLEO|nr:hypothetical protein DM02DRAFT_608980 [Periconia macrospinosa]